MNTYKCVQYKLFAKVKNRELKNICTLKHYYGMWSRNSCTYEYMYLYCVVIFNQLYWCVDNYIDNQLSLKISIEHINYEEDNKF